MPDIPSKFQKDPFITFWVMLLTHTHTDRQTDRQTNKNRQKHNLLGGGKYQVRFFLIKQNCMLPCRDSAYSYPFLCSTVFPSDSCTLLKPLGGFGCHLAGTLIGVSVTRCVRWGPWTVKPQGKEYICGTSQNTQLQTAAKPVLCCYWRLICLQCDETVEQVTEREENPAY